MVQRWGNCARPQPAQALRAVPDVTAHPSTASVPVTVLLHNGPLLCGFYVPVEGFIIFKVDIGNWSLVLTFMTSLTGAEMSDNCGLWAPWLISAIPLFISYLHINLSSSQPLRVSKWTLKYELAISKQNFHPTSATSPNSQILHYIKTKISLFP